MCNFCNFKETWKGCIGEEYQSKRYSPNVYLERVKYDFYLVSVAEDETRILITACPKCGREFI